MSQPISKSSSRQSGRESNLYELNEPFAQPPQICDGLSYHPFSLVLIFLWTALIVTEVTLLEKAVAVAPTAVSQPWYYSNSGLPGILMTVFAQGHTPITAMHLSRLAASGLQSKATAPRTWRELFWSADKKWAGPLGILSSAGSSLASHTYLSSSFIQFSILTLVALATPLVLGHSYPLRTVDVQLDITFSPTTVSVEGLVGVDAYGQIAAGAGSWATNQTVIDIFNSTVYVPFGTQRGANASGGVIFLAGDVQGFDATLPGFRISGGCSPMQPEESIDDVDAFQQLCLNTIHSIAGPFNLGWNSIPFNMSYCSTASWGNFTIPSTTSALVYFTNDNSTGMLAGGSISALVTCETFVTTGRALLAGSSLTFTNFTQDLSIYSQRTGGEAIQDPLYGALWHLAQVSSWQSNEGEAMSTDMFGYIMTPQSTFIAPSVDGYANSMWNGATHMTASIAVKSRASNVSYPAIQHVPVSGRVRHDVYRRAAFALLGTWLAGIIWLTIRMWRPTFAQGLGSWEAARLWTSNSKYQA